MGVSPMSIRGILPLYRQQTPRARCPWVLTAETAVLLSPAFQDGFDIADPALGQHRLSHRLRLRDGFTVSKARESFHPPLSISVGIAEYDPEHPVSLEELLARADALMYEDKKDKRRV